MSSVTADSRIARTFARLEAEGRAALIPYITAGDPDVNTTGYVLDELAKAGCDLIELGFPFSDPMADGPAIQEAMTRALASGTNLDQVLQLVRDFRAAHPDTPLVLFGYMNPLYQYGLDRACEAAREAGADGLLIVDLPPEEAAELTVHTKRHGLDFIALFTPTSDDTRVAAIAEHAGGFAYYVSMTGVTGGQIGGDRGFGAVADRVARVREIGGLPVAVGFGIRTPEDAVEVAKFADAVVIGSALVRAMASVPAVEAPAIAGEFMSGVRAALDEAARS